MKKISLIVLAIFFITLQIFPVSLKYQDYVYNKDYSEYEQNKTKYDMIINQKRIDIKDSLINIWATNNDTSLRKIEKINKIPEYDSYGYYQNTGRLICENGYNDKLICEPEQKWVTIKRYISGYKQDTIWDSGYKNREEWLIKANEFANNEAKNIYPDFHSYDGHELNFLIKSEQKTKYGTIYLLSLVLIGISLYFLLDGRLKVIAALFILFVLFFIVPFTF